MRTRRGYQAPALHHRRLTYPPEDRTFGRDNLLAGGPDCPYVPVADDFEGRELGWSSGGRIGLELPHLDVDAALAVATAHPRLRLPPGNPFEPSARLSTDQPDLTIASKVHRQASSEVVTSILFMRAICPLFASADSLQPRRGLLPPLFRSQRLARPPLVTGRVRHAKRTNRGYKGVSGNMDMGICHVMQCGFLLAKANDKEQKKVYRVPGPRTACASPRPCLQGRNLHCGNRGCRQRHKCCRGVSFLASTSGPQRRRSGSDSAEIDMLSDEASSAAASNSNWPDRDAVTVSEPNRSRKASSQWCC